MCITVSFPGCPASEVPIDVRRRARRTTVRSDVRSIESRRSALTRSESSMNEEHDAISSESSSAKSAMTMQPARAMSHNLHAEALAEEGTMIAESMLPDCGVIYVATQELKFVCEAIASAESVRQL